MTVRVAAMPMREFLGTVLRIIFDPAILLFCLLISVLMTMGLAFTRTLFFLVPGIIFLVFTSSALMKYATMVTRALALGNRLPSAESAVFDYFRSPWAFSPWVVLVAFNLIAVWVWQSFGIKALSALLVLTVPLVPAAIAVTSVNCRPWIMFHVPGLLQVIRILGVDYFKVLLGWVLLGGLAALLRSDGQLMYSILAVFAGCIQVMFLFVSTGVVLFHHHEPLGIPIERDTKEARNMAYQDAATLKERRIALDQAYVFFSRDNSVGGMQRLRSFFDEHPADGDAWSWFVDEMAAWETPQPMLMLSRNYLNHLLADDRRDAAFAVLINCMHKDKNFAPHPDDRATARELLVGHAFEERAQSWR